MATTLTAKLKLELDARLAVVQSATSWTEMAKLGTSLLPEWTCSLTDGTTANKAQKVYAKKLSISSGGSTTIDLNAAAGDLASMGTINFASIKVVAIRLRTPVTGKKLVVGNAAADPWAPFLSAATTTIDVPDLLVVTGPVDGFTVGAAANLKIAASGADCVADLILVGH